MCSQTAAKLLLVVDDDPSIRETLAEILHDEGYTVMTAVNGQDALTRLRASAAHPCVILLDLMMPVMSGPEFYDEMQNDPSLAAIPVVVISADGNARRKVASMGGEFIAKPVKIETVLSAVESHCP
ncbi:MAG TPA: response regulator [Polyangia bacterium]|nr:response regulator [Polyangia bacterium]